MVKGMKYRVVLRLIVVATALTLVVTITVRAKNDRKRRAFTTECLNNLAAIDGQKRLWALDNSKNGDDVPTDRDLFGPDTSIPEKPTCPDHGTYDLKSASEKPTCSVPGHAL